MQIRLTRKLADSIDGIDLSRRCVGDLIDLPEHHADLLIAEGWASPAASGPRVTPAHRGQHQSARCLSVIDRHCFTRTTSPG
jgi:hypothetical protein